MTDEDALLAAMRERPHDHTPRLVLADWYDDHDMPHEALYHRGVVASRQAAEATARVGDYLEARHAAQTPVEHESDLTYDHGTGRLTPATRLLHDPAAGARFRHSDIMSRVTEVRQTLGDAGSPTRTGHGFPDAAAEQHRQAAGHHRTEAARSVSLSDPELTEMYHLAADLHDRAAATLSGIFGSVKFGAKYRDRRTPGRVVSHVSTSVHTDPETGRATPIVRAYQTPRPTGITPLQERAAEYHPAEFHNTYERA